MTYTIAWHLKTNKEEVFQSPNIFTLERAEELADIANDNFKRAKHWVEVVDAES